MDRPARDSAADAHSLARAQRICLCPTSRDPTGLSFRLRHVSRTLTTALYELNWDTSLYGQDTQDGGSLALCRSPARPGPASPTPCHVSIATPFPS